MLYSFFMILFILCCLVLVTVILMQSGRGEGLAGMVSSDNVQSALGPRASDVLEKITWGVVVVFFAFTIFLSVFTTQRKGSIVDKVQVEQPQQPVQQQPGTPATATPLNQAVPPGTQAPVKTESAQPQATTGAQTPAAGQTPAPAQPAPVAPVTPVQGTEQTPAAPNTGAK